MYDMMNDQTVKQQIEEIQNAATELLALLLIIKAIDTLIEVLNA